MNTMNNIIQERGQTYLLNGMKYLKDAALARYIQPLINGAFENSGTITKIAIGIFAAAVSFCLYKESCKAGETKPMEAKKQMVTVLTNNAGGESEHPMISGTVIEDPAYLDNLNNVKIKCKSKENVLVEKIDKLETREDMVSWIIAYQAETTPLSNGKDVVDGTVACGLVGALRLAMAGENLGVTNDAPKTALIEMIKHLRDTKQLGLLNAKDMASFHELQKIETHLHNVHKENYDIIGKALTALGVTPRAIMSYVTAKVPLPTDFAKATLGGSRVLASFVAIWLSVVGGGPGSS